MPQEIEIHIPSSMRISRDVGEIGRYVAMQMGVSSVKEALEAIIRKQWKNHLNEVGDTQTQDPSEVIHSQPPINAASALDSVL